MLDEKTQTQIVRALNTSSNKHGYEHGPYHEDVSEEKPIRLAKLTTQICGVVFMGTRCGQFVAQASGFRRHVRGHFVKLTPGERKVPAKVKEAEAHADRIVLPCADSRNYTAEDILHFQSSILRYVLDGSWHDAQLLKEHQQLIPELRKAVNFCLSLDAIFRKAFGSAKDFFRGSDAQLHAALLKQNIDIDEGTGGQHIEKGMRSVTKETQSDGQGSAHSVRSAPAAGPNHLQQFTFDPDDDDILFVSQRKRRRVHKKGYDGAETAAPQFSQPPHSNTSTTLRVASNLSSDCNDIHQDSAQPNNVQKAPRESEEEYFPRSRSRRRV